MFTHTKRSRQKAVVGHKSVAGGGSTRLKAFLLTSSPTPTYKNVAAFVQLGAGENMQTS